MVQDNHLSGNPVTEETLNSPEVHLIAQSTQSGKCCWSRTITGKSSSQSKSPVLVPQVKKGHEKRRIKVMKRGCTTGQIQGLLERKRRG